MSTTLNPTLRQRALMSDAQMRALLRGYYLPQLYQNVSASSTLRTVPSAVLDLLNGLFGDPLVSLSVKAMGLNHPAMLTEVTERLLDLPGLNCLTLDTPTGRQYYFTYTGDSAAGAV